MKNLLFPVFLKTEKARFLIIGGGNVGLEKTETLLRQNPDIHLTIVSVNFKEALLQLIADKPNIKKLEKAYDISDLEGVDYLIIATNNSDENRKIKAEANRVGLKVNAADQPDICDFYLGSIVNKGYLKIAFSTNGKSPVLARRLKEYFNEVIPDNIDESITNLNEIRNQHKGDFVSKVNHLNEVTAVLSGKADAAKNNNMLKIVLAFAAGILVATLFIKLLG